VCLFLTVEDGVSKKMSYQLVDQVKVWWKTVSDKESLGSYQKTVQATWNILRETGKLVWLVFCLGLVLVTWIWTSSKTSSQKLKTWYEGIQEPKSEHLWAEVSQFLTTTGRTTATQVMTQAREQLGLPAPGMTPTPVPRTVAAAPAPVAVAAATPPTAPEPEKTAEEAS
jgi:hypothetical protein